MGLEAAPCGVLQGTGWASWEISPLAGDASARRYWRLAGPRGDTALLLDNGAPGGAGFDAFLEVSSLLRAAGFAAPKCFHVSADRRYAVIEDLGPMTLARYLQTAPDDDVPLYSDVAGLIAKIHLVNAPAHVLSLTPVAGAEMLDPFFEYGAANINETQRTAIRTTIKDGLARHANRPLVLALRDFHAENLIWRPGMSGVARFGLIDFQDAFLAPPEYDLASLIRDARRDVSRPAAEAAIMRFGETCGRSVEEVSVAVSMLAIQRNLRILGIFARLIKVDGKTRYQAFLPRVRKLILEDLDHPGLAIQANPIRDSLESSST